MNSLKRKSNSQEDSHMSKYMAITSNPNMDVNMDWNLTPIGFITLFKNLRDEFKILSICENYNYYELSEKFNYFLNFGEFLIEKYNMFGVPLLPRIEKILSETYSYTENIQKRLDNPNPNF